MSRSAMALFTCAAVGTLLPAVADACPACAARGDGGFAMQLVYAAMMILPFGIAGAFLVALKRAQREEELENAAIAADGEEQS